MDEEKDSVQKFNTLVHVFDSANSVKFNKSKQITKMSQMYSTERTIY